MNNDKKGHYAKVNGLEMYYEIHGEGEPLILLHGVFGLTETLGEILPLLAKHRQVIAVDLQAHGRTADIDRPLLFEAMADDIAALIQHLGFEQVDVMGHSMGGGVALRTVIQYPELVRRLVVVSFPVKSEGWYPGLIQIGPEAAESMKQTPMYHSYASVAPRVEDWPVLLTKIGEMVRRDYDWSREVATIKTPTMIVIADADSIRTAHAVEFFELLGGGKKDGGWDGSGMSKAQLAILPGLTHYNIFNSPALATTVVPFLESPMPQTN